ncbi:unnamed protein product [Phaedon cochleariae]|uniref:Pre-C2HC domain-containing protein n=1 Tax=Phaedon cochleariae TaxID=80249 RepID=A0A9N9SH25_PHACE|nr:unnamed protein product [Phaedon cochleariae]
MLNLPEDLDGDSLVTLLHQILERLNKLNPHNQLSIRPVSDQPQSDHLPKYGKRPFQDTNDLHETNYEKEFPMIPLSNRFDQLSKLQDDEMSECSSVKSSSSQKSVRARKSLSDRNVRDDISCPYFNSELRSRSRSPQMPQMSQFQQNSVQLKRQGSKVPMNSQHKPSSSSLRDSIPTKIDKNNVSVNQNVDNHQVRVPPIILRDKTKWTSLSKELPTLQINYFKAVNTTEGIKVFCDSPDSFRALTRLLDNKKYPFHTYQLPDEKSLRVVLRNVSEHIEPDDISEELTERGFEVTSVHRMKRRDGTAMPIVLVLLPKTEKNREIYDITRLVGLTIKVEPQRPKAQMWQIILLAIFPHIIGLVVRPLDPIESPLWEEKLLEAMYPEEEVPSSNSDSLKHRYPYDDEEITGPDPDFLARPPSSKRALAMFARWGSINGIGKNRPPIRSHVFDAEDAISAQTRGRMLGQPLRWG